MKKLILACSVGALALVFASCDKNGSSEGKSLGDSIAHYMGSVQGADLARSFNNLDSAQRNGMTKERILAGVKTVLMADTADKGYLAGLNIGMGLLQQLAYPEQSGVPVNHSDLFDAFSKAFMADSMPNYSDDRAVLQELMQQVQRKAFEARQAAEKARQEEMANSPLAKANASAGAAYIAKTLKEDEGYKKSESGIVYKIHNEGTGENPTNASMVSVKYAGRHIDGSEFDSSNGQAVDFPVSGVVPGFSEAIRMLKKGGSMTVIIPGELAYGSDGTPDGSIGPNETLVFDITLDDIK